MITFDDNSYTEEDIKVAKKRNPNALRRCYARIAESLDDFHYGLLDEYNGKYKLSVMEMIAVAHHFRVKVSTMHGGVADDLFSYLQSPALDMDEEDYLSLVLSEPKEEWDDEETPSHDISGVVINNFEDYLESVYYSPHVQKLLKEKEFKDLLSYLNIDDVHAVIDGCQDWIEIY